MNNETAQDIAILKKEIGHVVEFQQLADLSPVDYDKQRGEVAKKLGIRTSTLDKAVREYRKKEQENVSLVEDLEPWPDPVDGNALFNEVKALVKRHIFLPDTAATAITLWIAGSYCINAFGIFPKLLITSPEKRCGKSSLMNGIIHALTCKAITASNITPAAMFRIIDACQPTLLVDEADTFLNNNDELRGIINSGHTRNGAHVIRVVGDNHDLKKFSTWSPMAIAMIKKPPGTIIDRSIVIEMRRRLTSESIERIPLSFFENCRPLRQKLARWSRDEISELSIINPCLPHSNNDRALDNWSPLFTIAQSVRRKWPQLIEQSFNAINSVDAEDSLGILLLADIQSIFEDKNLDRIHSVDLVNALLRLEERPWATYQHGKNLTVNNVSRLLKPFGVKSAGVRIGTLVKKGYTLKSLQDAFFRYLPPLQSVTPLQVNDTGACSPIQNVTGFSGVTFQKPRKPLQDGGCNGVTLQKGDAGKGDEEVEL